MFLVPLGGYETMNRLFPLALFAAFIGGCARSDLGEQAASQAVKSAVEGEADKAKESLKTIGTAKMMGGTLTGTEPNGEKIWELRARLIETKEPGMGDVPKRAIVTDAQIKLFRAGQLESTFSAPLIEFFNADDGLRLAMRQGVRATNVGALGKDGVPIAVSARRGDVNVGKRLVSLAGNAKIVRGVITVTGQKLLTQTDLARSEMSGDVAAVSPQGTTRAKNAVFAWKNNRLAANGVTFTRDDLVLTGAKLVADTAAQKGTLTGDVRAQTPTSTAQAPSVDFDWSKDVIRAPRAMLTQNGAQMKTGALQTDSHLKVGNAQDITINKDGAVLTAASARGFAGFSQLTGQGVTIVNDGTTLTAARAKANNWSARGGVIEGAGGVSATNKDGRMKAPQAVWSGGENGRITASGGVEIVADGTTIRGARAVSDAKFNVATLSGDVRAKLDDGSTLNAPTVDKRGKNIVASGGAVAQMKPSGTLGSLTIRAPRVETTIGGQTARASGGVNLKSASGVVATAPQAVYDRKEKTVFASGGFTYSEPGRGELKGETLKTDLKLTRARMTGVKAQSSGNFFDGKNLFE